MAKDCTSRISGCAYADATKSHLEVRLIQVSRRSILAGDLDSPFTELNALGLGMDKQDLAVQQDFNENKVFGDGATEITSSSSRYGLTFPGSTSTGDGISEFLYP